MLRSPSHSLIRAPWTMTPRDATMESSRGTYSPSLTENSVPTTYFTPVIDSTWRPPNVNDGYPQSNDPIMTPSASDYPNNSIVVAVLIALICILFLILIFVTVPPILHIIKRRMPVPQATIDRRYATVDGWLIRKRVQPHDFACECIQQRYSTTYATSLTTNTTSQECGASHHPSGMAMTMSSPEQPPPPPPPPSQLPQQHPPQRPSIPLTTALLLEKLAPSRDNDPDDTEPLHDTSSSSSSSRVDIESIYHPSGSTAMDDDNDENSTTSGSMDRPPGCTICLEAFQVGDSVSWSTDQSCGHVFHHSCIREWLLRRVACPCCRTVLLPVDRPTFPLTTTTTPAATQTIQRREAENIASPSSSGAGTFTGMSPNVPSHAATTTRHSASRRKVAQTKQRLTPHVLEIYAEERSRRTITSYYCVQDGLVTLDAFGLVRREPTTTASVPESLEQRFMRLSRGSASHRTTTDIKEIGNSPSATTAVAAPSSFAASADASSWLESVLSRILRRSDTDYSNVNPTNHWSASIMDNGTHSSPSPDQTFDMLEEEEDELDLVIQDDDGLDHSAQIDDDDACTPDADASPLSPDPSPPQSSHHHSCIDCESF